MRKRVNAILGMPQDKRMHEMTLIDEVLACQDLLMMWLEALMMRCPGALKGVLYLVAMVLTIVNVAFWLMVAVIFTIVGALYISREELKEWHLLGAIVVFPIVCVLMYPQLMMVVMESGMTAMRSMRQSWNEGKLIYKEFAL